ncbi:tetratricopeptide repeat protein [Flavobacterium sp.]|uniref:tetratricopeptide repeat protein n=1 Tax=Flavobacterium sp. TaxID=239 RepID=UPI002B4B3A8A|nr:tetratricopeptide repeat protein [Flavobacterium sp.]HLP63849.1 tetratricopeptide repeat protein [Flavobacterium sp.]
MIKISRVYTENDLEKALSVQKVAMHQAQRIGYQLGIIKSYNNFGKIYLDRSDFYDAINHVDLALKINKNRAYKDDECVSYLIKGQCYLFLNNFPESSKNLTKALQIAEQIKDPIKIARIYNNIAIIYNKQEKLEEEQLNYQKALQSINGIQSPAAERLRNIISSNIALNYLDQKQYDKALTIFQRCFEYEKKLNYKTNLAGSSRSLSKVYLGKKEYSKALEYAQNALELYTQLGNKSGQADVYREIGVIYLKTNQLQDALDYTQKGLQLSTKIGELESIKFCYENLSKIHSKLNNYKEAYTNQVLFKKMSDSMFNSEINDKVTQIQMTYEFDKKQEQLKRLQNEKDTKLKSESNKQRNFLIAIAMTLFFLSLLTIGIYFNLKSYKKQKNIVEQQKEQIQNSLTEKETLLREIHHRVKNNLQIISSLLNMQSEDIEDQKVLLSIQEGQSRVQAMSLIHQNLYQSEHIDKVNIENYFKELTNYLSTMYKGDSNSVKVTIETSNIQFDFDTAIPLGLIVNELVSNAYKHAFSNKKEGQISIQINAINSTDYQLLVSNDGEKLPSNFDWNKPKSLGMKLVTILSKQLRGSFSLKENEPNTTFEVLFKDLKEFQKASGK